jgi:hypothetical protein
VLTRPLGQRAGDLLVLLFSLAYPIALAPVRAGWRPDPAFLVFLGAVVCIQVRDRVRPPFVLPALLALTCARSDLGLLAAAFCLIARRRVDAWAAMLLLLPVAVQGILSYWVFPDAQWYCPVVRFHENLSLAYVAVVPLTYILPGAVLLAWLSFPGWRRGFRRAWPFFAALIAYVGILCVIALVNETRLFLHLVPFTALAVIEAAGSREPA